MIYNPQRSMEMIESHTFTEEMKKEYLDLFYVTLYKKNKKDFVSFLKFLYERQIQEHDEDARDNLNTILYCLFGDYTVYHISRLLRICEKLNIK